MLDGGRTMNVIRRAVKTEFLYPSDILSLVPALDLLLPYIYQLKTFMHGGVLVQRQNMLRMMPQNIHQRVTLNTSWSVHITARDQF